MTELFMVHNDTDGLMASPEALPRAEAEAFMEGFRARFERQGFYSSVNGRIPVSELRLSLVPAKRLTIEEFRASRREAIAGANDWEIPYTGVVGAKVLLYLDALVIEDTDYWPKKVEHRYYLSLENQEYCSNDLAELEATAYEWCGMAGWLDKAEGE